ncbi:hypothetical protein [Dokdonella sp.]|uniref:hypothetical protein n=1 Tax=Dokdonella sp. TaxID=2291710 RepID=UPI002F406538
MRFRIVLAGALAALVGTPAFAQTCASPIQIGTQLLPYAGYADSCMSSDNISYYDGGAIYAPGRDIVYRVYGYRVRYGATPALRFILQPNPGYDPALFACGQCGVTPTCFDAADSFGAGASESMIVGARSAAYYLVVDSLSQSPPFDCGGYNLFVAKY